MNENKVRGLFDVADDGRLVRAFRKFHNTNPHVYDLFNHFALEAVGSGRSNFGVSMIWERMRWYTVVETDTADTYKLNNNHRAYYARLWMKNNPRWEGFFRTRKAEGD